MKTLTINDLARTEELGRAAMAAVRGGFKMAAPATSFCGTVPSPTGHPAPGISVDATQKLQQMQEVVNSTADGSAYLCGIYATNDTSQYGQNNITVG